MLFLSLNTFSRTGGIQQFNRCMQLALCRWAEQTGNAVTHMSLYDAPEGCDTRYGQPGETFSFRGYANRQGHFLADLMHQVPHHDVVIFGHINLVPLSLLPVFRGKKNILIAHGVEVWKPLPFLKRWGLKRMGEVWAVSGFTAGKLASVQKLQDSVIRHFPNCLDPFLAAAPVLPVAEWNKHWRLDTGRRYILTLARLSSTEQAKGYDAVIQLLPRLAERFPDIGYLLAGKWDDAEYARIRRLADSLGVTDRVLMPGFVAPEALPAVFGLASVFAMPSSKEGFGIVYLEAAWWGCPVVANRAGGAPEALLEGRLGILAAPGDDEALFSAIARSLEQGRPSETLQQELRELIAGHYGFEAFCARLHDLLRET